MTKPDSVIGQLHTEALPAVTWRTTDDRSVGHALSALKNELCSVFLRYTLFKGNKVAYLRYLGVRIGIGCDILTSVKNFGTEPWLIELGNQVTITNGVVFLTHDGANRVFRSLLPESSIWGNRFGRIKIADNCFIGVNTIILPDVEIGRDSIVGAGSLVIHDVEPRTVVAGVPARPICTLEEYAERYQSKMINLRAESRDELRRELTTKLWGEPR
jgi:acetyltransferase-like isoleucine patch superfamily enzyme